MDALEEAVNDVAPVIDASKDSSPTGEVSWIDNPSMTASQYAQVVITMKSSNTRLIFLSC